MRCQRKGCARLVPAGRRKYCSDECRKKATVQRRGNLRNRSANNPSGRGSKVKNRTCLGCGAQFLSEGPWNRFCEACAHRNAGKRHRRYAVPAEWPDSIRLDLKQRQ